MSWDTAESRRYYNSCGTLTAYLTPTSVTQMMSLIPTFVTYASHLYAHETGWPFFVSIR
jgi:hypothetical protein